jgi:rhombotail lipoprotein
MRGLSVIALASVMLLGGCTALWQSLSGEQPRQGTSSSLVEFLYPSGAKPPPVDEAIPVLTIPLRVGLAFVPGGNGPALPEATRMRLLEQARTKFVGQAYVEEIVVVPEAYLESGRGFAALDQVARLYDLDVMALVSYDQVSIADDRTGSLLYWTVVGAYVVKGSQNDVSTFVDTAVFDLKTRRLLLRAPGTNQLTATATLVRSADSMRAAREESFELAMADMTRNLADELGRFETRIKTDRSVLIAREGDASGAGALGPLPLLALASLALLWRRPFARG